jgi:hypothetical protein
MTKTNPGRAVLRLAGIALVLGSAGPVMGQTAVATGVGTSFELAFWQSIDSSNDPSLYDAYLTHFPNGTFSEIARVKIVTLRGRVSGPVSPALTVPVAPSATPPAQQPIAQPTPVAVRVMQPANAVVEPIAATTPVVAEPVTAPPVAAPPVVANAAVASPAPAAGTLGQLLAALATSQASEAGGQTASASAAPQSATLQSATLVSGPAPAPVAQRQPTVSFAIPAQPALYPVPSVAFPPSFCSAEQRNAFHDQVYAPSVNTARRNNEAAAAYLRQLQGLYDQYQMSRDPDTMNAIVVAARTYEQVAQTTFSMQAALVRQFGALMAVPVVACAQPAQPLNAVLVK